eukprot:6316289-Prymnesium_polylepis.1
MRLVNRHDSLTRQRQVLVDLLEVVVPDNQQVAASVPVTNGSFHGLIVHLAHDQVWKDVVDDAVPLVSLVHPHLNHRERSHHDRALVRILVE